MNNVLPSNNELDLTCVHGEAGARPQANASVRVPMRHHVAALRWALASAALGLVALSGPAWCDETASPPLTVTAHIVGENGRLFLEFEVTSRRDAPMSLAGELLPWRSPGYTLVMAIDPRDGRLLEDSYAVLPGIVGGETVSLLPRATLKGRIDLQKRYPDLKKRLAESDMLALWSHRAALMDQRPVATVAGVLVLSRQTPRPRPDGTKSKKPTR